VIRHHHCRCGNRSGLLHHDVTAAPPNFGKEFRARIAQTSRPDRTGSLPNRYLEAGDEDFASQAISDFRRRCGFKEQFQGFAQVVAGVFDGIALARDVEFRAERHVAVPVTLNDCGELSLHGAKYTTGLRAQVTVAGRKSGLLVPAVACACPGVPCDNAQGAAATTCSFSC